jgi:hypothetical protein
MGRRAIRNNSVVTMLGCRDVAQKISRRLLRSGAVSIPWHHMKFEMDKLAFGQDSFLCFGLPC